MRIRNLKLFYPDDRDVAPAPETLIEQINPTPFRWETHCRDVADRKYVDIDLMSADINFSKDGSDPGPKDVENSWGLAHALMGLARRAHDDGYGNHLPFAWEVRTVSPDAYRKDSDATRLYGLLRSLAAQPKGKESLEQCIQREFAAEHPKDKDLLPIDVGTFSDILIEDLAHQPSRKGDAMDVLRRLLPRWRTQLWSAIAEGSVRLHVQQATDVLAMLKKQKPLLRMADAIPVIPIDNRGRSAYGISLFSAVADLVDGDSLDVAGQTERITIRGNASPHSGSVVEWYESLIAAATGEISNTDPAQRLAKLAIRIDDILRAAWNGRYDAPSSANEALNDFVSGLEAEELDRALLFIILIAHSCLRQHGSVAIKTLAEEHRIHYHDYLFQRPIAKHESLFEGRTPSELARQLRRALTNGEHQLGGHWQWMRQGLRAWYDERLLPKVHGDTDGIFLDIAKKLAPGLFDDGSDGGPVFR